MILLRIKLGRLNISYSSLKLVNAKTLVSAFISVMVTIIKNGGRVFVFVTHFDASNIDTSRADYASDYATTKWLII